MNFTVSLKCVLFSGLLLMTAQASADQVAGKALYNACVACHGNTAEGNPAMNGPGLTGQSVVYLSRQLSHFKRGVRGADAADVIGGQMRAMSAILADEQAVADVSEYIASLPVLGPSKLAQGDIRNGNNRYQGNCGSCHGGKAEGNELLNSPRLAGLEVKYLLRQYNNFKQGLRGTHPDDRFGRQMKFMANSLPTEQDLLDVTAYIHSITSAAP